MDNTLALLVLGIVVLAIVALLQFFRRKTNADDLAPPMLVAAPPASGAPKIATAKDIDAKPFTRWLCDQACAQTGLDLRKDPIALTRLSEAATKAQNELANAAKTEINLPYISADARGPKHFTLKITREQVAALPQRMV